MAYKPPALRPQHLSMPAPETVRVIGGGYERVAIINKDAFDSEVHTLVNELGQKLDERGAVIPESTPPAGPAAQKK